MSKDRARPFSRKHRKYWITVTGGMLLIAVFNVVIGYCSYDRPSDVHERIIPNVPNVPNVPEVPGAAPGQSSARPAPGPPVDCRPAIRARIETEMPGAQIEACAADRVTLVRDRHRIDLELAGDDIRSVGEVLALPEIPAAVMRAFAVAYPRTIPSSAVKRTRRGAEPVYELAFPPGQAHKVATLRGDGTVIDVR